jgi:hypothetical protein
MCSLAKGKLPGEKVMQKTSMLINERFFALMLKHSAFTPTRSGPKEDPEVLFEHLRQECERFATLVEHIPISIREIEPCYIRYQSPKDRSSTDYQPVSRRKKGDLLCQHR